MARKSDRTVAGVSEAAVKAKTGRSWKDWFALLDKAGAKKMPHKEIASMLAKKHKCPSWWSQTITVGYERARGLRAMYQHADGFTANISKTVAAPLRDLYEAWEDAALRESWLGKHALTIRKATARKRMRITWSDGKTSVDAHFLAKGRRRSLVAVEHSRLANARAVAGSKALWSQALQQMKSQLER